MNDHQKSQRKEGSNLDDNGLRGKVMPVLDVVERLTITRKVEEREIIISPTIQGISDDLKERGADAAYSQGHVHTLLLQAEEQGWVAWPKHGSGYRRMDRTIIITQKGREELTRWREEQAETATA